MCTGYDVSSDYVYTIGTIVLLSSGYAHRVPTYFASAYLRLPTVSRTTGSLSPRRYLIIPRARRSLLRITHSEGIYLNYTNHQRTASDRCNRFLLYWKSSPVFHIEMLANIGTSPLNWPPSETSLARFSTPEPSYRCLTAKSRCASYRVSSLELGISTQKSLWNVTPIIPEFRASCIFFAISQNKLCGFSIARSEQLYGCLFLPLIRTDQTFMQQG